MSKININLLTKVLEQKLKVDVVHELKFHPIRKWRFDLAIPAHMIAIEIDGGVWTRGRHTRGQGFINDCTKTNQGAVLGWKVLRYTHSGHSIGDILTDIENILNENH